MTNDYFCGAGAGAGVAGCVLVWDGLSPCSTEFVLLPPREAITESVIDVIMKMTVDQVVALERAVAAPRGPNAVWLPIPPKAAAMSPLFPLCSSTTMIRKKETITWIVVIRMIMQPLFSMSIGKKLVRKGGFEKPLKRILNNLQSVGTLF